MRQRSATFLAIAILLLLLVPVAYSMGTGTNLGSSGRIGMLASSGNYSESLSLYLTSAETLWQLQVSGGNISISSLSVPSSVTSFSIMLTSYQQWSSQFEVFSKNGFGFLGASEPLPNGAILSVNTTSSADASSLASSLDQTFALAFAPLSSSSSSYTFISPLNFQTELHVYFWKLLPYSYKGFVSAFSESQVESNDLAFFKVSYASGSYSIATGGLKPLVSPTFSLYSQLGISPSLNYSSLASSSSIAVHVLGGLVSQSNFTYSNYYNNFSASMFESSSGSGGEAPNLNATLDFSFPTIVASRSIATLNPTTNQTVGVTITVKNISPSGTPSANNVEFNDSWVYSSTGLSVTQGNTFADQNLSSGGVITTSYAFKVLHGSGSTFSIPPIPVSYQFTAANKTLRAQVYLNTETVIVNGTGPAIEGIESVATGAIQTGQSIAVNVTATNKGTSAAFNLVSAGQTRATLLPGQSWTFNATSQSASLAQTNSTISYTVSWQPSGPNTSIQTNTISSIYSFATPGSPASSLSKSVSFFKSSGTANVTLSVLDNSAVSISNLTVSDSLPSGTAFVKSFEPSSLKSSGNLISANITTIGPNKVVNFTYALSFSNVNENYVFYPANVASPWNNVSIIHFSQGEGLALGVFASNEISPSAGFQGSSVRVQFGITNRGTLPVYDATLSQAADPFLSLSAVGGTFKSILQTGSSLNSSANANFTGAPGNYSSSSSVASFIFAGANQTALSNSFNATIYEPVQTQLSVISAKIEEDHNIEVMVEVTNPSGVTVTNVGYTMSLPSNLNLLSGQESFQIPSIPAGGVYKNNITFSTSLPQQYTLNGTLNFQYNGQTLKGQVTPLNLNIVDDLTLRYGIPVLIGLVIVLATLFYVRKLTSQKKV
ncbi:MAG TPA: hypothetical protein VJN71_07865 [Nitrososphaerales archaeon]|nr:hypothetical protein [Nitrososphaerales archaeon]